MARKSSLSTEALAALGAEKLAQLLLNEAERNAPFRKIVKAALAGTKGPEAIAKLIDRRLAALEKARSFIDWQKERAFREDLAATVRTIVDELGAASPAMAIERLLRFIATHESVFERVDDSGGRIQSVYRSAMDGVAQLTAKMAEEDLRLMPGRLQAMLRNDEYGYGSDVALSVIPLLPRDALADWDERLSRSIEAQDEMAAKSKHRERDLKSRSVIAIRQAIADARGDLDAFIALETSKASAFQDTLGAAKRLLEAGRAEEALDWVRREGRRPIAYLDEAGFADGSGVISVGSTGRPLLEARILEALGRKGDAQALLWSTFESGLDIDALREHVNRLGDFEEFEVLDRAFAHVMAATDRYRALQLLLRWPRLDLAAELVVANYAHWDGRFYHSLADAADIFQEKHPLAATILYRALLSDILERAKSQAYGHGARYLKLLDSLAGELSPRDLESAGLTDHETYRASLRKKHGRKSGFWSVTNTSGCEC
jgi:hypothetical protein